jgi:hypothetical protein
MINWNDMLSNFETKYLNAPEYYEITCKEDFNKMLETQPWEIEARKNKKCMYLVYRLLSFLQDIHTYYRRFVIALRYFFKPTNKITFRYMPKEYVECDYKIFLAAFEIFGRWVEEECPFENIVIEDHNREEMQAIKDLYDWWVVRRDWSFDEIAYCVDDEQEYKKDSEMLLKLITMRGRLWC